MLIPKLQAGTIPPLHKSIVNKLTHKSQRRTHTASGWQGLGCHDTTRQPSLGGGQYRYTQRSARTRSTAATASPPPAGVRRLTFLLQFIVRSAAVWGLGRDPSLPRPQLGLGSNGIVEHSWPSHLAGQTGDCKPQVYSKRGFLLRISWAGAPGAPAPRPRAAAMHHFGLPFWERRGGTFMGRGQGSQATMFGFPPSTTNPSVASSGRHNCILSMRRILTVLALLALSGVEVGGVS